MNPTDKQVTQMITDMQARLDTCSQSGQAYRVKWHEVKTIIETIQSLQERLAEAKKWQMSVEEREAAVCPEDVGFDEYIRHLESKLAATTPPTTPSAAAMRAAKDVVNEILNVPRFVRNPEDTIIEIEEKVAAIITRHFPQSSVPTLSNAIDVVEGLYNEWWDNERRRCLKVVLDRLGSLRTRSAAATTSPETPNNETVSDEYAEGFENGCAFTVAAFLENLGHLNYIFDGLNCCKICGLVKPAEGWKKQCKGPTGLRIDASPETPVGGEAQKCVKCGHSKASPDDGLCDELLPYVKKEPFGMEMCGCKCEFAAVGADEGEEPHPGYDCGGTCVIHAAALRSGGES